ncbi:ABC transporter [Aeromicrobium sp. Root495]|uniref:metal ABC transporter ATP-binding protein n=1 Tax=Aeromicrobium sp. Root495 TaxID=1736550 RepID=UPI0006FF8E5F|nr:metal ABC transporter ATP-binding protein [Aeromicrobium sp. Root495]KQY59615.1 ABC transporter [Aeromicrobium sp. Root495]
MTDPIRVTGLDVHLDARPVLRDVSMHVGAGELVTILGANGSGKSTLVRTAVGLITPTRGEVTLFGTPIDAFREWHKIGYVPQRSASVPGVPATIDEVVSAGLLSQRRLFRRIDRTAVGEALERVGLAHLHARPVAQLSGGQHQRVLIARALVSHAELLVMDEPTAGVDHENTVALAELLGSLVADGTTVALVAHDLGPVRPFVSRAVVLSDGRVTYDGPCEQLSEDDHHDHPHHDDDAQPAQAVPPEGVW